MPRLLAPLLALTLLLAPAAARAATSSPPTGGSSVSSGGTTASTGAAAATPGTATRSPSSTAAPASGTLRGAVVSVGWAQLTVRPHSRPMAALAALTASANAVAAGDFPYVWGGGHPSAGVPSAARPGGPIGYDCSGSVAAVLAGAGLWPAGVGVPSDAGIVATLRAEHLIAPGAGSGPDAVTLWDDPGTHIFLQIGAAFFGTSDGAGPSPANPAGGPGWLDDGAADTLSSAYHPWHVVPAALAETVSYGPTTTLGVSGLVAQAAMALAVGDQVAVAYVTRAHALVAASVTGPSGSLSRLR